jgi:hypothetical protein
VTESLGELRAALDEVSERLHAAHRCAQSAGERLAEAVALLTELGRSYQDGLVPPELARAGEELSRGLGLISGGADAVAAIEMRL